MTRATEIIRAQNTGKVYVTDLGEYVQITAEAVTLDVNQARELLHSLAEFMILHTLAHTQFAVPYTVIDTFVQKGQKAKVLGHFYTEADATMFIETLPSYTQGRYVVHESA